MPKAVDIAAELLDQLQKHHPKLATDKTDNVAAASALALALATVMAYSAKAGEDVLDRRLQGVFGIVRTKAIQAISYTTH